MKAITMITLTAMLMASGWAEDEDCGRSEMSNFIGGVYRGEGSFAMTKNVANGPSGSIIRSGNTFFTPEGVCRKVGNTYLCYDGVVVSTGKSFVGYDHFVAKAGNTYVGDYTSVGTGSTILRPSWASR
jgi:hypothetical protein